MWQAGLRQTTQRNITATDEKQVAHAWCNTHGATQQREIEHRHSIRSIPTTISRHDTGELDANPATISEAETCASHVHPSLSDTTRPRQQLRGEARTISKLLLGSSPLHCRARAATALRTVRKHVDPSRGALFCWTPIYRRVLFLGPALLFEEELTYNYTHLMCFHRLASRPRDTLPLEVWSIPCTESLI